MIFDTILTDKMKKTVETIRFGCEVPQVPSLGMVCLDRPRTRGDEFLTGVKSLFEFFKWSET